MESAAGPGHLALWLGGYEGDRCLGPGMDSQSATVGCEALQLQVPHGQGQSPPSTLVRREGLAQGPGESKEAYRLKGQRGLSAGFCRAAPSLNQRGVPRPCHTGHLPECLYEPLHLLGLPLHADVRLELPQGLVQLHAGEVHLVHHTAEGRPGKGREKGPGPQLCLG